MRDETNALNLNKITIMHTFSLRYHKNSILLLSMLGVPLACSALTLIILLNIPLAIAESIAFLVIALSLLLMALILRWAINSFIIIPCKVSVNGSGITFRLEKNSFLYSRKDFYSDWENISHISEIFCGRTGNYFQRISFRNPHFSANFSATENNEAEADKFFAELQYYREIFKINRQFSKLETHPV